MLCPKVRQDGGAAKERLRNAHETRSCHPVATHVQLATTFEWLHGRACCQPSTSHPCPHKLSRTLRDKGRHSTSARPRRPCPRSLGLAMNLSYPCCAFPRCK